MFESEIQKLPESLRPTVDLSQWSERLAQLELPEKFAESIVKVWVMSEFVSQHCTRHPEILIGLCQSGDLFRSYGETTYREKLAQKNIETETDLMTTLRHFRRNEMVRLAWRDISDWEKLTQILRELSWLAEACIQTALDFLYQQACEKRGTPVLSDGTPQQIVVLGMGKLGAYELNYSSDIDLIFAYAENGVLPDRKETTYSEFFTRLCQSLVRVLDEITADGFVFRTDIRLRPFGDSGAIIMTFDGMENYYQTQAREWERYAMIKARQVAGDFEQGKTLMSMLRAFVYRRYLDYGAFEELRSLKAQIVQELRRKDRVDNVKLGRGGIREIEFIGQAFQLIRGGNDKSLQTRGILDVLKLLSKLELLNPEDATQLTQSYHFLRRVENRIQQYQDKQTHDLPTNENAKQAMAYVLGFVNWETFLIELNTVRDNVHAVFDAVFSVSKQDEIEQLSQKIWRGLDDENELLANLSDYGFQNTAESWAAICNFKNEPAIRRLSNKGLGVINRLMPQVISTLQTVPNPDETLKRLLTLFTAVAGRNVYLALLAENPHALAQLLRLASASPWIGEYLARYPVLFDELLDTRSLFEPLKKEDLDAQLNRLVARIDTEDLESLMIALRQFKQVNVLRIAAADIMGVIPLMTVSDYLTFLAESIVDCVVRNSWQMLVEKHGYPPECDNDKTNFAIIGFGKLGGFELSYGSDLDMVFVYDCNDGNAMTKGEKSLSCSQFYARLGQKIRHILDTKLLAGELYEVDLRLRPNGDSGALVTHINSYENYLTKNAWTWELQALVRSRFVAGDVNLGQVFSEIRQRVLSLPRDIEKLKTEVREMREKMRENLAIKSAEKFDLKQSVGGIVDIEFMVQFSVLANAANSPALTIYTDNIRLLERLQIQNILPETDLKILTTAYCTYRDAGHKRVLQGDTTIINAQEFIELREQVTQIWQAVLF
ncbi:MAG: bifunctional [glutamate--ammonia ligase]-adenylyl-L-tyrosine phosphorylase/[glutamate--ammonia-ligase] adenylyltransferase [Methylococcales bacterium]|nr:bifunctional [glutamate--ammonia ligase]-adenylyl-L-tyrosine phosphorylase/[glutamate--ammonia-ligase] adenylyltransferase [Methylococcales bacterium]